MSAAPRDRASWEPIVGAIGPKVRELRAQAGLSLQQLSARADVSAAAIHKVERGDMVPTITTLLKLAAALDRPIGWFVDDTAAGPFGHHVPVGERPAVPPAAWAPEGDGVVVVDVAGPAERFRVTGVVVTVGPGGDTGPRPTRAGEELVVVLEGAVSVEVAGEQHDLRAGDALHLPTDRPHRLANPGRRAAQVLVAGLRG